MLENNPMGSRRRRRFYHRIGVVPVPIEVLHEFVEGPSSFASDDPEKDPQDNKFYNTVLSVTTLLTRLLDIVNKMIALAEEGNGDEDNDESSDSQDGNQSETEDGIETEDEAESESENEPESESENEADSESGNEAESESENEAETESEGETEIESENDIENGSGAESHAE